MPTHCGVCVRCPLPHRHARVRLRSAPRSDDQIATFKGRVYYARNLMLGARWGGVGVAIASGLVAIAFVAIAVRRRRGPTAPAPLAYGLLDDDTDG